MTSVRIGTPSAEPKPAEPDVEAPFPTPADEELPVTLQLKRRREACGAEELFGSLGVRVVDDDAVHELRRRGTTPALGARLLVRKERDLQLMTAQEGMRVRGVVKIVVVECHGVGPPGERSRESSFRSR